MIVHELTEITTSGDNDASIMILKITISHRNVYNSQDNTKVTTLTFKVKLILFLGFSILIVYTNLHNT